jgi:hypothetical protein
MESDRKSYLSVENLNVSYKNNHVTPELERAFLIAIIAGPVMGLLGTFITLRIFAMSLGGMLGRGKLIRPATSQLDRV